MSRRFIVGEVETYQTAETARRRLDVHRVVLPVEFLGPGGRFADPTACQWDTGSELSVMSEALARRLGVTIDDRTDTTTLVGVTGAESPAWVVPRFVRFPGLDGLRFRFHFLVLPRVVDRLPLLGMRDTYRNFEVYSHEDEVYFFPKPDHTGQPV